MRHWSFYKAPHPFQIKCSYPYTLATTDRNNSDLYENGHRLTLIDKIVVPRQFIPNPIEKVEECWAIFSEGLFVRAQSLIKYQTQRRRVESIPRRHTRAWIRKQHMITMAISGKKRALIWMWCASKFDDEIIFRNTPLFEKASVWNWFKIFSTSLLIIALRLTFYSWSQVLLVTLIDCRLPDQRRPAPWNIIGFRIIPKRNEFMFPGCIRGCIEELIVKMLIVCW